MSDSPLCLVMIVRNEAHRIEETLTSVKSSLGHWIIVDTGSTDATPSIISDVMAGVSGTLDCQAFTDFATTRNQALDLADQCAPKDVPYRLMLSGDTIVHEADGLPGFLSTRSADDSGAYYLRSRLGSIEYDVCRMFRASEGWRYEGAVHETARHPSGKPPAGRVDGGTWLEHLFDPRGKRASWLQHAEILEREHAVNPSSPRTVFYLAQTYHCLRDHERAHELYMRRVGMGGWHEERYEAQFRAAVTAHAAGHPWAKVDALYREAHRLAPHRAEPLCRLAEAYLSANDVSLAYLFASMAFERPYPVTDRMFVDRTIYDWKAADVFARVSMRLDDWSRAAVALRRALSSDSMSRPDRMRLESYLSRCREQQAA